jgi:hypothetical protein
MFCGSGVSSFLVAPNAAVVCVIPYTLPATVRIAALLQPVTWKLQAASFVFVPVPVRPENQKDHDPQDTGHLKPERKQYR